eukprot:g11514.t1
MTPEMLHRARATLLKNKNREPPAPMIEFRLGELDHLPCGDGVVDCIISNCVINLCADKQQVYLRIFEYVMFVRGLDVSPIAAGRSAAAGTTLTTAQFGGSSSSTHNGPPTTGPYSHRNVGGGYTSADHAPAIGGGSGYVHAGGIKNSRNFGMIRPTFPPSMDSTRTNLRALNVPSLYSKGGESVPTLKHVSKQDPRWDPKNTRTSFLSKDRRVTRNVVFGMGPPRPCSLPVLKSVSEEVLAGGGNPGGGASPAATRPRQAGASPPRGFVRQWVNVRQQLRRLSGDEPELPSAVVNPVPRDLNQRFPLVSDTPGPGRYNSKKSSYYPPPAGAGFLTLAGAPGAGGGEGAYNCVPPTMKGTGVEDAFFKDAKSGRSGKEALQCFGSFADRGLGPSASPSKNRVKTSMFKRTPQRQLVRAARARYLLRTGMGRGGVFRRRRRTTFGRSLRAPLTGSFHQWCQRQKPFARRDRCR